MRRQVAIVYNRPVSSRYNACGEEKAVAGVLEAVNAVNKALLELGYSATLVPLEGTVQKARKALTGMRADVVFNLFEGFPGAPQSEALVPETLDESGIPYTGCSPTALRLGLDKAQMKAMLRSAGLNTPDFQLLDSSGLSGFSLNFPCIVKPCSEDASHGISSENVVHDFESLAKQVTRISGTYGAMVLVEEFIGGREFNATVLGDCGGTVLPASEIEYSLPAGMPNILSFAAKWEPDSMYFKGTPVICPAKVPPQLQQRISETALAAFRLLKCRGYARVDMRLDKYERVNIIEINPNPDISPGAGSVRQAEAAGMSYPQFIDRILRLALENS